MRKNYLDLKTARDLQTENAVVTDSGLVCRGGLSIIGEPLFQKDGSYPGETEFILTDCYLRRNLKSGRVAVISEDNLMDSVMLSFLLIFADGSHESLGSVNFNRVSVDSFGRPESFSLFSGTAITGDGVFLICRQVYGDGTPDFVSVREFSFDSGRWNLLDDSNFYAPLLLSNGRGNSYFLAVGSEHRVSFPAPIYPETENLLSGMFRAEFSSDGSSSDFELPKNGLSDEPIVADFSYMGVDARWIIPSETEYSNTVSFIGNNVVMVCDRAEGRISFKVDGNTDFPLPFCGKPNNLVVTATKRHPEASVLIASASACTPIGGAVSGGKNGATLFYKNRLSPSLGFFNHPEHPLYFPEKSCFDLGNMLLDTAATGDGITLFTREAIFTAPRKNTSYAAEDIKKVCDLTVSLLEGSVASSADSVFFLSRSGDLFCIKNRGISLVASFSDPPPSVGRAIFFDQAYLFISGREAFVCQIGEKPALSKWTFPVPLSGGFAFGGDFTLFPTFIDYDKAIVFSAALSGQTDDVLVFDGAELGRKSFQISAKCRFSLLHPTPRPVRICKFRTDGKGEATLRIIDGKKALLCRKTRLHRGKLLSGGSLSLAPTIELQFSSDGNLKGLSTEYYII